MCTHIHVHLSCIIYQALRYTQKKTSFACMRFSFLTVEINYSSKLILQPANCTSWLDTDLLSPNVECNALKCYCCCLFFHGLLPQWIMWWSKWQVKLSWIMRDTDKTLSLLSLATLQCSVAKASDMAKRLFLSFPSVQMRREMAQPVSKPRAFYS